MMKNEKGQALPLAMMALAFGTLIITPFLGHAGSSLIGSRVYGETIMYQGSCDAGVEHAIWNLIWSDLAEKIPDNGDEITYQLSEMVNDLTTTVTITANITGDGGTIGEIEDEVLDSLEFDTVYGQTPDIINVSGNTYAVAYRGNSNYGFLKTVEIETDGTITNKVLDSLEFDTSNCSFPDIVRVSEGIFAIAYQGQGNDGFIKTVVIAPDGNIGNTVTDTLEFDTQNGREPDMIHISGNIYAIAYRGNNADGYVITVEITPKGDIAKKTTDSLEYDTSDGYYPDIIHISGDIYAIAYRGSGGDGFITTVEINEKGKITNKIIDSLEFDTSDCYYPNIINISGDVYAIAYEGNGNDGFLKTVQIASNSDISNSVIDTLEFNGSNGREPVIIHVTGDIYAIVYRGDGNDGFVTTVEIAGKGNIANSVIDTLEYDTSNGLSADIIHIFGGIFAIAYCGPGTDGFVKTIEINLSEGTSAAYEIVATTGSRTISAYVNTDNETASIILWQVE
jgi:hypothetical protein